MLKISLKWMQPIIKCARAKSRVLIWSKGQFVNEREKIDVGAQNLINIPLIVPSVLARSLSLFLPLFPHIFQTHSRITNWHICLRQPSADYPGKRTYIENVSMWYIYLINLRNGRKFKLNLFNENSSSSSRTREQTLMFLREI